MLIKLSNGLNTMKKVVFLKDEKKLKQSFEIFDIKNFSNHKVPVKLNMGEIRNKYFPKPDFVKKIIFILKEYRSFPYLFDTTVAYKGPRYFSIGYKALAKIHGFTKNETGAEVLIDDKGIKVNIEQIDFEVANHIYESSHIFTLSHVKGHDAVGFGGAIKNLGMGGVTKKTKINMHNGSKPIFKEDKCVFCGVCENVCPCRAIIVKNDIWKINNKKCFGCGVCVDNCKKDALTYKENDLQYVLACSAKACTKDKKVIYLNELRRITRLCDCNPRSNEIICPDIGLLVSDDPVAIDKASIDLVYEIKKDVFKKFNHVDPNKQIRYGEKIGLGSSKYKLIEI